MKHLFISQDYAPDLGGMARRHVELCRRMAPDEITVSTVSAPGAEQFDRGETYRIARQPFAFAGAKILPNQMRWARWLVRECRKGVDIIHCGNIRPAGYPAAWARARTGVPYLLYVNGGDLLREQKKVARNRLKRATGRVIFEGSIGIVSNSEWTAALATELMQQLRVRHAPPVKSIHLGTDPSYFRRDRDTGAIRKRFGLADAPVLLTIARLVPHKGQDVAIRAVASLRESHPGLRYLIVGGGPFGPRLRALVRELGVDDMVVFAGNLTDDEIAEAYATATIYLGLSRQQGTTVEGFGISFSEAASSSLVSIGGDSGGVRSAVRDGETGIIVPPEDSEAVAAAIRSLLDDPAKREAMGARARQAVESHYNWDRVAAETRAFAREALQRAGRQ